MSNARRLKRQARELILETQRLEKVAGKSLGAEVSEMIRVRREALIAALSGGEPGTIAAAGRELDEVFEAHLAVYRKSTIREYLEALAIALALALFIRHFFIQAFEIPSGSMRPTLLVGDYLLVNKAVYGFNVPFTRKKFWTWRQPKRGEIVVFVYPEDPSKDFIKRVVGLPGDKVKIEGTKVWVNGGLYNNPHARYNLDEPIPLPENNHMELSNLANPGEDFIVVPEGHLFVMGDNRDNSSDSRVWGYVPLENLKGKALVIYFSKGSGFDFRWKRFFSLIE